MVELKFCGLTRPEDAAFAAELGAEYVGVIVAGGPRVLDEARARQVLGAASGARRVGVFGVQAPDEVARIADALALDVIQLHADPTARDVETVRTATGREVWAAVRVSGADLPTMAEELARAADGLLLDARLEGALGGTGTALDWSSLRVPRTGRRLILAGGLRPGNVARAIALVAPDVVDVSSGVESAPGVKDHDRMRAFAGAARSGAPR